MDRLETLEDYLGFSDKTFNDTQDLNAKVTKSNKFAAQAPSSRQLLGIPESLEIPTKDPINEEELSEVVPFARIKVDFQYVRDHVIGPSHFAWTSDNTVTLRNFFGKFAFMKSRWMVIFGLLRQEGGVCLDRRLCEKLLTTRLVDFDSATGLPFGIDALSAFLRYFRDLNLECLFKDLPRLESENFWFFDPVFRSLLRHHNVLDKEVYTHLLDEKHPETDGKKPKSKESKDPGGGLSQPTGSPASHQGNRHNESHKMRQGFVRAQFLGFQNYEEFKKALLKPSSKTAQALYPKFWIKIFVKEALGIFFPLINWQKMAFAQNGCKYTLQILLLLLEYGLYHGSEVPDLLEDMLRCSERLSQAEQELSKRRKNVQSSVSDSEWRKFGRQSHSCRLAMAKICLHLLVLHLDTEMEKNFHSFQGAQNQTLRDIQMFFSMKTAPHNKSFRGKRINTNHILSRFTRVYTNYLMRDTDLLDGLRETVNSYKRLHLEYYVRHFLMFIGHKKEDLFMVSLHSLMPEFVNEYRLVAQNGKQSSSTTPDSSTEKVSVAVKKLKEIIEYLKREYDVKFEDVTNGQQIHGLKKTDFAYKMEEMLTHCMDIFNGFVDSFLESRSVLGDFDLETLTHDLDGKKVNDDSEYGKFFQLLDGNSKGQKISQKLQIECGLQMFLNNLFLAMNLLTRAIKLTEIIDQKCGQEYVLLKLSMGLDSNKQRFKWLKDVRRGFIVALLVTRNNTQLINQFFSVSNKKHLVFLSQHHKKELFFTILHLFDNKSCVSFLRKNALVFQLLFSFLDFDLNDFGLRVQSLVGNHQTPSSSLRQSLKRNFLMNHTEEKREISRWLPLVFLSQLFKKLTQPSKFDRDSLNLTEQKGVKINIFFDQKRGKIDVTSEMKISNLLSGVLFNVWDLFLGNRDCFLRWQQDKTSPQEAHFVPIVLRHLTKLLFNSVKNFFDRGFFDRAGSFFEPKEHQKALFNFSAMRDHPDALLALFDLLNVFDCYKSAAQTFFSLNTPPPKRGMESQASFQTRVRFNECPKLLEQFLEPNGFDQMIKFIDPNASSPSYQSQTKLYLFTDPSKIVNLPILEGDKLKLPMELVMRVAYPVIFKWLQERKNDRNIFKGEEFDKVEGFLAKSFLLLFPSGLIHADKSELMEHSATTEYLKIFGSTVESELDANFTDEDTALISMDCPNGPTRGFLVSKLSDSVRHMTKILVAKSAFQAEEDNPEIKNAVKERSETANSPFLQKETLELECSEVQKELLEFRVDKIETAMWDELWNFEKNAQKYTKLKVLKDLINDLDKKDKETEFWKNKKDEFDEMMENFEECSQKDPKGPLESLQSKSHELGRVFAEMLFYQKEKKLKIKPELKDKLTYQAKLIVQQRLEMMQLVIDVSENYNKARREWGSIDVNRTASLKIFENLDKKNYPKSEQLSELRNKTQQFLKLGADIDSYEKEALERFQEARKLALELPRLKNDGFDNKKKVLLSDEILQKQRTMQFENVNLTDKLNSLEERRRDLYKEYKQAFENIKDETDEAETAKQKLRRETEAEVRSDLWKKISSDSIWNPRNDKDNATSQNDKNKNRNDLKTENLIFKIKTALSYTKNKMEKLEKERKKHFSLAVKNEKDEKVGSASPDSNSGSQGHEVCKSIVETFAPVFTAIGHLQEAQKCGEMEVILGSNMLKLLSLLEKANLFKLNEKVPEEKRLSDQKQLREQRTDARALLELIIVKRIDLCLKLIIDFYSISPRNLRFLTVNRILDQNDMILCNLILTREQQNPGSQLQAESKGHMHLIFEDSNLKCFLKKHPFRNHFGIDAIQKDPQNPQRTRRLSSYDRWKNGKILRMRFLLDYKDYKAWVCEEGGDGHVFKEILNFKNEISHSWENIVDYIFKLVAAMRPDTPKPANIFIHFESFYCLNKPFYAGLMLLGRLMLLVEEDGGENRIKRLIHTRLRQGGNYEAHAFFFNLWRIFATLQAFTFRKNFQVKDYFTIYRPFFLISDFFKNLCEDMFVSFKRFFNECSEANLLDALSPDIRERYWQKFEPSKTPLAQIVYTNLVNSIGRSDLAHAAKKGVDIFDRPSHFYLTNDLVYMLTEFINGGSYHPDWLLTPRFQTNVWADILYRVVDDPNDYFYTIKHKVLVFVMAMIESEHQSLIDSLKAQISFDTLVNTLITMLARLYIYCRKKQRQSRSVAQQGLIFEESSNSPKSIILKKEDLRDENSLLGRLSKKQDSFDGGDASKSASDLGDNQEKTGEQARPPLQKKPRAFLRELVKFYCTQEKDFAGHQLMETAVLMMNLLYNLGDRLPEFQEKILRYNSLVSEDLKVEMHNSLQFSNLWKRVKSWFIPNKLILLGHGSIHPNEIVIWFFLTQIIDKVEFVERQMFKAENQDGQDLQDVPKGERGEEGQNDENLLAENKSSDEQDREVRISLIRFRKLPEMFFYSSDLKKTFIQTADVTNRETKHRHFFDDFDDKTLMLRARRSRYMTSTLYYFLTTPEASNMAIWVLFLLALAINVLMLLFYNKNGDDFNAYRGQDQTRTITALTATSLGISATFLFFWLAKRASFFRLKVLKPTNKARFMSSFFFYLRILWNVLCDLLRSEIGMPLLLVTVCYILGLFGLHFWLTIPLFLVLPLSDLLSSLTMAIFNNWFNLVYLLLIIFSVTSVFAILAVQFFSNSFQTENLYPIPEPKICETFRQCVVDLFLIGMYRGAGIAEQTLFSPELTQKNYFVIYFFRILSFTLIPLMLLGAFFGLVVDTFKKYKQQLVKHEENDYEVCFICGMHSSDFSRYNINFIEHKKHEHNIFSYFGLLMFLEKKQKVDFIGKEYYFFLATKNGVDVLPNGTCRTFKIRGLKVTEDKKEDSD